MLVKLSEGEKFIYNYTKLGDLIGFCAGKLKVDHSLITDDVMKQTCVYLYKRQPMFRAKIQENEASDETFFKIENEFNESEVDYSSHEVHDPNQYTGILEKICTKRLDENSLRWRAALIKLKNTDECVIVFVIPTYATDGITGVTFFMEILNIINSLLTNATCDEMKQCLELSGNTDQLMDSEKHSEEKNDEKKNQETQPEFFTSPYFHSKTDSGCKMNLLAVEQHTTEAVVKRAKSLGIKITGYFATCLVYALKQLYKENNLPIVDDFNMVVPASVRLRLKSKVDLNQMRYLTVRLCPNLCYSTLNAAKRGVWSDSVYAHDVIQKEIETQFKKAAGDRAKIVNELFRNSKNNFEALKVKLHGIKKFDIVLSNMGSHDFQMRKMKPGPIQVKEMYIGEAVTANPSIGPNLLFYFLTVNKRFNVMLSSRRHEFASEYSDRLIELFNTTIQDSLKNSKL